MSATVATALGLAVSIAVDPLPVPRPQRRCSALAAAPLVIPFIVLAVGLFLLFSSWMCRARS